jgi:hypothetical protein
VGLERGPLSLVSTIEELLERKSSGCCLEKIGIAAVGIRRAGYATPLYPQKLVLSSPTSGGRSIGIVRSRTQDTEFVCLFVCLFVLFLVSVRLVISVKFIERHKY